MRKCRYCDFSSYALSDNTIYNAYVKKLIDEIAVSNELINNSCVVDSIYIGGGTPSLLSPVHIYRIINAIKSNYNVSDDAEITIEVNPGTISKTSLSSYLGFGINRLSIGAQSFNDKTLNCLGRIHDADEIMDGYKAATDVGFTNISLDLMFGHPRQTIEMWKEDLNTAIALNPAHISHYSLQIEEGTPICDDIQQGTVIQLDDETDREMYHTAIALLEEAGYSRYEISNSAKPSYESKHNLKYWSMKEYLGFGLAAHSYINKCRISNTESLMDYLNAQDISGLRNSYHENNLYEEMSEYVFLGLRKSEGIDLLDFYDKYHSDFWKVYGQKTKDLIGKGLLENKGTNLRLTELGFDLANTVFCEYV